MRKLKEVITRLFGRRPDRQKEFDEIKPTLFFLDPGESVTRERYYGGPAPRRTKVTLPWSAFPDEGDLRSRPRIFSDEQFEKIFERAKEDFERARPAGKRGGIERDVRVLFYKTCDGVSRVTMSAEVGDVMMDTYEEEEDFLSYEELKEARVEAPRGPFIDMDFEREFEKAFQKSRRASSDNTCWFCTCNDQADLNEPNIEQFEDGA